MPPTVLVSAEQIQRRIREMAQEISRDYASKNLLLVCVLPNGFVFAADLIRAIDIPVSCQFVQPQRRPSPDGSPHVQIFYGAEFDVNGKDVLLLEGLVQSGQTADFLIRIFQTRGAASVKLAALVDKQTSRRVPLQPDYMGFIIEETFVVGYGMGDPEYGQNLPYLASR